jgi:hypothetical protein
MTLYPHKGTAVSGKVADKSSLVQASSKLAQAKAQESVRKLPLAFEANRGQTDPAVQFIARASGYTAFLTSDGVVMRVKGAKEGVLAMKMQNAKPANRGAASAEQPGKSNYFLGSDRSKWIANVAHYGNVSYKDAYPGIDVVYSGNQRNLQYDFVVKPGADPNQIRIAYQGSSRFALNAQGDLELQTPAGQTVAHKPLVYQTIGNQRKAVRGDYVLTAKNEVGFKIGSYDTTQPLVIDPTVTVLTFVGGTGLDVANAVAANASGVYLTGSTASTTTFPLTAPTCPGTGTTAPPCVAGAVTAATFPALAPYSGGTNSGGASDAYVMKLDATGTTLLWSTFLGGLLVDNGLGIAVDNNNIVYVTGTTTSLNFPVTNGTVNAGSQAAFITKIAASGQSLLYSTYYGGNNSTSGNAITVDPSGTGIVYVGGQTTSTNLVPVNAISLAATTCTGVKNDCGSAFTGAALQGTQDALVMKVDTAAGNILFSSMIGGTGLTSAVNGIALDSSNAIYIAGTSTGNTGGVNAATRFPTIASGFSTSGTASNTMAVATGTGSLGFATKITLSAANVPTVAWSDTFGNGATGAETAVGVALDSSGRVYVAGSTSATAFTLTNTQLGSALSPTGTENDITSTGSEGYVLALASGGKTATYITFLNAATNIPTVLNGIALDDANQAYVVGTSNSVGVSIQDIFVARLNAPGTRATVPVPGAANFVGKINGTTTLTAADFGTGIAVVKNGVLRNAFVAGYTNADTSLVSSASTGTLVNNTLNNYLIWGTASSTLTVGGVTPAKLPTSGGGVVGAPPGSGDAVFAALTFRDLIASSTNVAFSVAASATPANITQQISFTDITGGTPCQLGVVPSSYTGAFFPISGGTGTVGVAGNVFTIGTGTQAIPGLGTPVTGTFQVSGATGCALIEPVTVAVTYTSTTAYTATASYGTVTGASSIALTAAAGSTAGLPTSASLSVNVGVGATSVATVVTSTAPTSTAWPTGACANPITVTSNGTPSISAGTPAIVGLTVDRNCIAATAPGTYTGGLLTIASSDTPAKATSITIPYSITINPGITASGLSNFVFTGPTAPALAQTSTLLGTTGGPFSYTAVYTAATTSSFPVLPVANVSLVAGASGTIPTSGTTSLVVQVSPASLALGTYAGTITISPSGTSTFSPVTLNVQALVGNSLLVTQPATSPLTITLPTNVSGVVIPSSQLSGSQIVVTNSSTGSITITTSTGVVATFTGLTPSPLALAATSGATCTAATNSTCTYNVTATTTGVLAGTYSGTITFTTSSPAGANALSVTLPVTLQVTSQPTFIVTTSTASQTLLTGVNLVATSNAAQVCTAATGQPLSPGIATTGNSIATVISTPAQVSGVNLFTVTGPSPVNTGSQAILICANPQVLGTTSGTFNSTVTVSSTAAPGVTATIPVSLLLNSTPGGIDLSNIGVFRAGMFALDLDQATYNYNASTTKFRFFGLPGDQPVAGDWLGTGIVSLGVFRAGAWYFDLNNNGVFDANEGPFYFGLAGDTAIVGDWNGSGTTKVGVFRCPTVGVCTWYLSTATQTALTLVPNANLYIPASTLFYQFGLLGDQPVANSWSGTSKVDQIGVFRCPATGVCSWIVENVGDGVFRPSDPVYTFGLAGDVAVVGDWNDGGQRKRIGVFRGGLWVLEVNGTNVFSNNDIQASFGLPGDKPVVGKWTMP